MDIISEYTRSTPEDLLIRVTVPKLSGGKANIATGTSSVTLPTCALL